VLQLLCECQTHLLLDNLSIALYCSWPSAYATPQRTFSAIVAAAEEVRSQRRKHEWQEAERARLAKLEALAKREEQVWAQPPGLLAQRTASGYGEAVTHLAEQRAAFDAQLGDMLAPYVTSAALLRRLCDR
jgi:hypothetical protein